MNIFIPPAIGTGLAVVLAGVAIFAACRCVQRFRNAYRLAGQYACAIWFVRGIRCLIIALTAATWAAGFYWHQPWLMIVGLVILAQELYEGFVLSAALREGLQIENGRAPKGVL
jgi:hypothetical protein